MLTASAAYAQKDPTFSQNPVTINGLAKTTTITITSPYDDCVMTITAQSSNPAIATVAPPGPVQGNGPFTFTITSGTKSAGTAIITFLIGSSPMGCVLRSAYTVPVTVTDPGAAPPRTSASAKQVIEPVAMDNGALVNSYQDLYLSGPLPIRFTRYYYSNLAVEGVTSALGTNWTHNYNLSLAVNGSAARLTFYDGQAVAFSSSGGKWTQTSPDPLAYQLAQNGNTFLLLDPSSQLQYTFDGTSGQLQTIQDRNRNTQTLTYTAGVLSKVADGLGASLSFTYANGNLTNVTDQAGRSVSFSYNGGVLASSTDAAGKATNYNYTGNALMSLAVLPRGNIPATTAFDASSVVTSQKDGAGNTYLISVDPTSGLGTLTDPLGQTSAFTHVNRALTKEVDPAGNVTTNTYDANNRLLTRTDANGNVTAYSYSATSSLPASTTLADGGTTTYTYTPVSAAFGLVYYDLTGIAYPDGTSESFQHDANGNVTGHTDRNGQTWQATFNSHGQPLVLTSPGGAKTTFTYSSDGTSGLASAAFPDTSATTFKLDSLKRIVSRVRSDGTSIGYTYDANDHVLTQTDEAGGVTTYTYDANGLPASVKDADSGVTSYTRTGTDQAATMTDPAGRVTTFQYDADNRLKSVALGDGSTTQTTYDAAGNPSATTDGEGKIWKAGFDKTGAVVSSQTPLGNKTALTLDALGRVTQMVSPAGKTNSFAYDKLGRLTGATDPAKLASTWTYDKNGAVATYSLPGSIAAAYQRDADGRLTGLTDPNGSQWSFTYDGLGRPLSITDPLGKAQTFTRDARGRITAATLPLGTLTSTVDAVGRVTQTKYSDNTSASFTWDAAGRLTGATGLTFQYDASGLLSNSNGLAITRDKAGRVATVTLAPGKAITYTYDRRGLATSVADWAGGTTSLKWDDDGRLVSITRPNGVVTTYAYDADGDVSSIQEAGTSSLSSIALTRDARGLVTQATRNVPLSLTPAQIASLQTTHTFDAAGQIADFQYDAMGRRTSDDAYTYTWDMASHLTGYSGASGSSTFTYNAMDLIASQTLGGVANTMVWNFGLGLPSVSVVQQGSSSATYYIHTPDGLLLHSIDSKGTRRFYHFDEMGNALFLTDDTGAITDQYAYSDYGTLLAPGGTVTNPFLFAGRYGAMQVGAGLYAMRQRIYDSRSAAFLSRDPLIHFAPNLINPYQYAANNPLRYFDVTGAEPGGGAGSGSGSTPGTASGQGQQKESPKDRYDRWVKTIDRLYKQGKISAVLKNKLMKLALDAFKDAQQAPENQQQSNQMPQGPGSSTATTGSSTYTPAPASTYLSFNPQYPIVPTGPTISMLGLNPPAASVGSTFVYVPPMQTPPGQNPPIFVSVYPTLQLSGSTTPSPTVLGGPFYYPTLLNPIAPAVK
jgi:RHS repeat-associated protein